ncbi:MAG: Uma2 family endonuclease [Nitrospinae bacterium]|nr:Uma2 family endonuclease [Nitrospinota bacterium]
MQAPSKNSYRWKSKDLERLPDEPFLTYEIIDGELIVSRQPHLRHGEIIAAVCEYFRPAVKALGGMVLVEPGIVWGEEAEDNVAPDIAVVLPDRLHLATGRTLSGTPNIVMEIVSPGSIEIDYVNKRDLYARTGAQEYWIIDWQHKVIEVWTFTELPARAVAYTVGQTITTPLIPGLTIAVDELLS